jgi:hypothetical protein
MGDSNEAASRAAGVLKSGDVSGVLVTELAGSQIVVDFNILPMLPNEKRNGVSSSLHIINGKTAEAALRFPGAPSEEATSRAQNALRGSRNWYTQFGTSHNNRVRPHILRDPDAPGEDPQVTARKMLAMIRRYYK